MRHTALRTVATRTLTTVSGSIETAGDDAYGIWNIGVGNKTTVSGSIKTGDVVAVLGMMHTAFITLATTTDHRLWQHYDDG